MSLQKKRNDTYNRRWFVLKANLLFYQERPADRHLLGVIVLEGCAVQHSETDGHFTFSLVFGPGLKTYRFAAIDRQGQESWVKALHSASHCYLSMVVKDLARQYEGVLGVLPPIHQILMCFLLSISHFLYGFNLWFAQHLNSSLSF